jgi:hypothetical protein
VTAVPSAPSEPTGKTASAPPLQGLRRRLELVQPGWYLLRDVEQRSRRVHRDGDRGIALGAPRVVVLR